MHSPGISFPILRFICLAPVGRGLVVVFSAGLLGFFSGVPAEAKDAGAGVNNTDSTAHEAEVKAWKKASVFLFDEAHHEFHHAAKGRPDAETRVCRLGEAMTLLALQPRTQANLASSRKILEEIIAVNSKDETGLAARMHLARIYELHTNPRDPQRAKAIYEGLLEDGLGNPLAELSASRLVLMDLYSASSAGERDAMAKSYAPVGGKLKTKTGRREFYSNLGFSLNQLGGDKELAMESLIAAEAEGFPTQQLDAPALIVIGSLAEELGRQDIAKKYYKLFVSRYQRDARRYLVLEKLEKWGIPSPSQDPVAKDPPQATGS